MAPTPAPPSPHGAGDLDELSVRLRELQAWAGVSYRELHRRIVRTRRQQGVAELPSYNTVYRCLQPGRTRLDLDLVVDVATALLGDAAAAGEWRQSYQVMAGQAVDAAIVTVSGTLPDDLPGFTGRRPELDRLLSDSWGHGGTVVISAIAGMAGVGKTQLAVHAAHLLTGRGRFTEVQLTVNLRGYDPSRPPADPAAVLDSFLRRLGMQGSGIHALDLAGRSARFRELMAGRAALLILDNAAAEDQVRPLLPHSATCLVLVTSRRRLAGLPGARHLSLDVFTESEALDVLTASTGRRVTAEQRDTAAEIARLSGHLPLALALVASRIRARSDWSLADHLEQLAEHRTRLRLDDGVEIALQLSYAALPPSHQRLLRLLALHPGRDLDDAAAAALAAVDLAVAREWLADLQDTSVVQQRSTGRYELHDLVRVFAAARTREDDAASVRRAALTRLFDHYRYSAAVAMDLFAPQEAHRRPPVSDPGTPSPTFADRASAATWLEAERANLISAGVHAADHGWPGHAGDLSTILYPFLDLAGHYADAVLLHRSAIRVAAPQSRGYALNHLGCVYWRTGRLGDAMDCFRSGVAIFEEVGDAAGHARTLGNAGLIHECEGRYPEALEHYEGAATLFHQVGDRTGEARSTGNAGCTRLLLGQNVEALACLERSLTLAREAGDRAGEGATTGNVGCCHEKLGNHAEALRYHQAALAIATEVGHRDGMAEALRNIGLAHFHLDRFEQALDYQRQALVVARDDGNRQLEARVRNGIGASLRLLGSIEAAAGQHREALAIAEEMGDLSEVARSHAEIAAALTCTGAATAAREHLHVALRLYRDLGAPEAEQVAGALSATR